MRKLLAIFVASLSLFFTQASLPLLALNCSDPNNTAQESIQCGIDGGSGNTTQTSDQAAGKVDNLISTILNILSVAVGIVAVIMVVLGGFKFITSAGNAEKLKSARNSIMYAVIGLVIVALAQVLVLFVLNKATADTTASKGKCVATQFGYIWEGGPKKGQSCTP